MHPCGWLSHGVHWTPSSMVTRPFDVVEVAVGFHLVMSTGK